MPHTPLPSRADARALIDRHAGAITVLMNLMLVKHLTAVYRSFDGDLVEAIVLGEIAHYNLSAMLRRVHGPADLSRLLQEERDTWRQWLLPTNALSIAQGASLPRETVRRKVASLVRRGWIVRDDVGNLFVSADTYQVFAEFHVDRLLDLLAASRAIETLVQDDPRPHTPSTQGQPAPSGRQSS